MKPRLLLLLTLLLTINPSVKAVPDIVKGTTYHIVCRQFAEGCVADGASVGQETPLFYLATATTSRETLWLLTEVDEGLYTIKNAMTGQYVTYDGVRDTYRRYVSMTQQQEGMASLWTLNAQSDGVYTIRNAQQTDHIWDVRVDSYMVGTYSNNGMGNLNQLFSFYDLQGNMVTERTVEPVQTGRDVSTWLEATTESGSGWQNEGGWSDPGFGNYANGEALVVSPFLERWQSNVWGGLPDCSLTQTLHNLPAGNYTLQADMVAVLQGRNASEPGTPAQGVYLFAADQMTEASTYSERPRRYAVTFETGQMSDIDVGVLVQNTTANWIAIDNIKLIFNGTSEQLTEAERLKVAAELSDYYSTDDIQQMLSQAGDDFDALESLRNSVATLPKPDPLGKAMKNFAIDGRTPAYVESGGYYLATLPLDKFGGNFTATITYDLAEGCGEPRFNGLKVSNGSTYTFRGVTAGKQYTVRLTDADNNTLTFPITFTALPVVRLYGSFSNTYSQGTILVNEPDKDGPELLRMKAKWRGGITNNSDKHKRNYHVKLLDADGNKLERKFFSLRKDNSWILEACQVDMSRIRNRVLTDLWNDYSEPPYYAEQEPKALTGTRGQFVELILNGEYRGIYCMTENMDRKQMKLKKYDEQSKEVHGQLWKSKDWSYAVFMGHAPNSNYYPATSPVDFDEWSESWDQYYVKYPDIDDVRPTDWRALYDAVNFVCTATDEQFSAEAAERFDMPLLIDYYILMETILSTDNHGKNMFFAVYDRQVSDKITFGVWDMDATCGQRWSDVYFHSWLMQPEQDYAEYITREEHGDYNLFRRLRQTDADGFNLKVRMRYRDLRKTHLSTAGILARFKAYFDKFATCGADQREYDKWNGDTDINRLNLDFEDEMDYLTDWFTRRMDYLDKTRFDIASLPSDVPTAIAQHEADKKPRHVYNLNGQVVGTTGYLKQLPSGVYVIGGKKVVRR